ncbi:NADP-binding protein [Dacryopinax primogenitus]|uniref:NADP-binding protein n=1 Tax=Dacryopinax primogenitus (strain DJM 731) TaxID=1858805 RepID=M5GA80_DACPD|nr:NADP-binding protein [Dacryopinax primogenitus]EJU02857.1 NADP-binding protein [Dacryopinax primogenitus]
MGFKVVIAGASGTVGKALVAYALAHTSHTLLCLDKTLPPSSPELYGIHTHRIEHRAVDLSDYRAYRAALEGADALVHLAGIPSLIRDKWTDGESAALVHNTNVVLSFNALQAAAEAGIKRVVMAGSINAIGGVYSPHDPIYDFFPVDETHAIKAADAYSLSKAIIELQADSIARGYPEMTITTLRLHHVTHEKIIPPEWVARAGRDLWGWVNDESAARAFLLALEREGGGAEIINVIGDDHRAEGHDAEVLAKTYHPKTEIRRTVKGDNSFYTSEKAEQLLGWRHSGGRMPKKD